MVADDSSLIAETSTRSYGKAAELPPQIDEGTIASTMTDEPVQTPEWIPANDNNSSSFEKPDAKDLDQHQKTSILSSSNQSSFDTDSPSIADTPEHSPKKKSKRRVPILNVSLPSFGKKHHHRSSKSPDQSSDSDRSGSPSKKFPWRKKSPKKAGAAIAVGEGFTEGVTPKDVHVDALSDEDKTQEEGSAEMSHKTTCTEDFSTKTENVTVDVPLPETTEDDRVEQEEGGVSQEARDEGQEETQMEEGGFEVSVSGDVLPVSASEQKLSDDGSGETLDNGKKKEKEGEEDEMNYHLGDDSIDIQEDEMTGKDGEVVAGIDGAILGGESISISEDEMTGKEEEEHEDESPGEKTHLLEGDSLDAQEDDDETSEMLPGVKIEGN